MWSVRECIPEDPSHERITDCPCAEIDLAHINLLEQSPNVRIGCNLWRNKPEIAFVDITDREKPKDTKNAGQKAEACQQNHHSLSLLHHPAIF